MLCSECKILRFCLVRVMSQNSLCVPSCSGWSVLGACLGILWNGSLHHEMGGCREMRICHSKIFVNAGVWHVADFISPLQNVFKNALMFHGLMKLFVKRACVFLWLVTCYYLTQTLLTLGFIFFCKGEFDKQEVGLLSVYSMKVAAKYCCAISQRV